MIILLAVGSLFLYGGRSHALTATFNASGTWTVPTDVYSATFEAWGGGGAGGGATSNSSGGGGGAGGQYAITSSFSVNPGDLYTVAVATTTTGTTGSGSAGGDSSVTSPTPSTVVLAKGGAGGTANNGAGGTGSITGGIGDTVFKGGNGATGATSSGGGGGGAGSSGDGGSASGTTAGNGTSTNGGNGGTGVGTSAVGNPGNNYGGGGSGGARTTATSRAGGNGAQGFVTVTYTVTPLTFDQNSFQWLQNTNGTNPTTKLNGVNQNTATTLSYTGQPFRLRQLIKASTTRTIGSQAFNEQYADLSSFGSCSSIPSNNWNNFYTTGSATFPGTTASAFYGNNNWSNVGNITATDGTSTTATVSNTDQFTYKLQATNFGFSIPGNAIISGVTVTVIGAASSNSNIREYTSSLLISGTPTGNVPSPNPYTTSLASYTHGSPSYLWGTTLTPAIVNNSTFGFEMSHQYIGVSGSDTVSVDSITMSISYYNQTPISYYDNTTPTNASSISSTANDPTESGQSVATQTYQEADGFNNTSSYGGTVDGMWDLSLYDNGAPANTTYCLRTVKSDGTPLDTYTQYPMITTSVPQTTASTPTLISPASGATNISTYPTFTLRATDAESDYIRYRIYLYRSNCTTVVGTSPFDQNVSQLGWSGQDASSNTAYAGNPTLTLSTIATYTYHDSGLIPSTVYCWKADAIDPGGTGFYSATTSTQTFTTQTARPVNIRGNVNIGGGTTIR